MWGAVSLLPLKRRAESGGTRCTCSEKHFTDRFRPPIRSALHLIRLSRQLDHLIDIAGTETARPVARSWLLAVAISNRKLETSVYVSRHLRIPFFWIKCRPLANQQDGPTLLPVHETIPYNISKQYSKLETLFLFLFISLGIS